MSRSPDGFREVAADASCDADRVVAVASRQFLAIAGPDVDQLSGRPAEPVDRSAVTAFYRDLLTGAQWQIDTAKPPPGPDAAALCATKQLDFGTAHVSLSFPVTGMYELAASDAPDPGARCR